MIESIISLNSGLLPERVKMVVQPLVAGIYRQGFPAGQRIPLIAFEAGGGIASASTKLMLDGFSRAALIEILD